MQEMYIFLQHVQYIILHPGLEDPIVAPIDNLFSKQSEV